MNKRTVAPVTDDDFELFVCGTAVEVEGTRIGLLFWLLRNNKFPNGIAGWRGENSEIDISTRSDIESREAASESENIIMRESEYYFLRTVYTNRRLCVACQIKVYVTTLYLSTRLDVRRYSDRIMQQAQQYNFLPSIYRHEYYVLYV